MFATNIPLPPSSIGNLGWFRPIDEPVSQEVVDSLQSGFNQVFGGSFLDDGAEGNPRVAVVKCGVGK